jgi:hypothetical protein
MKGDIALAGFVMTAEEWEALDTASRAQLMAAAMRRDDPWQVAGISNVLVDSGAVQLEKQ